MKVEHIFLLITNIIHYHSVLSTISWYLPQPPDTSHYNLIPPTVSSIAHNCPYLLPNPITLNISRTTYFPLLSTSPVFSCNYQIRDTCCHGASQLLFGVHLLLPQCQIPVCNSISNIPCSPLPPVSLVPCVKSQCRQQPATILPFPTCFYYRLGLKSPLAWCSPQ